MRALTVRNPWAWAIIHGGKSVENRSRNIAGTYRGPVAIHAGKQIDHEYDRRLIAESVGRLARARSETGLRTVAQVAGDERTHDNEVAERYGNRGAIIGVVDLVDVHWSGMECSRGLASCHEYGLCSEWAQAYHHHLILANPRPLPEPIPYRGALGLWTLSDDVLAGVRA